MNRLCLLLISGLFFWQESIAQSITINSQQQPIEQFLQQLHQEYGWPLSYHPQGLGECTLELQATFSTPQEALTAITEHCALQLKVVNGVFIILKENTTLENSPTSYSFRGIVIDQETQEPLPFATVVVNNQPLVANENGRVVSNCPTSVALVEVTHLGYYNHQQNYSLEEDKTHYLFLQPASTALEEIVVESQLSDKVSNGQEGTGLSQLNASRLPFLPGNTTNSLFSYLRLQAGVMAAGEPEKDFILWGSYKGQSHLLYDGITLFSPTSYNNVLGMVNPAFVQAVEVHKGGQQVDIGDRAGGVVHLHSPRGSFKKNHYEVGVSNQLIDAYINIGMKQKGNFQAGWRCVLPASWRSKLTGIEQQPFAFTDLHLKYTQNFTKGWSMRISALANFDMTEKTSLATIVGPAPRELVENINQSFAGASLKINKDWKKWGQSNLLVASSTTDFFYTPNHTYIGLTSTTPYLFLDYFNKGLTEARAAINHTFPATCWHQPSFGLEAVYQKAYLIHPLSQGEWANSSVPHLYQEGKRIQGYFKDRIFILPQLTAEVGLKWTVPLWQQSKLFLQPRLNVTYSPHKNWKLSWAMGYYQQFLTENSLIDRNYQHAFHWSVATTKDSPILESHHQVLQLSFVEKSFQARLNGYYKSFNNLAQYELGAERVKYGRARSYGLDLQANYNKKHYSFLVAYNLGRVEESFCPSCNDKAYQPAIQDQRHEIKLTGLLHWKYFTFSTNYVFGSGLRDPNTGEQQPYNRLDAALLFQYQLKALKIEAGVSILNVLQTYNRPYLSYQSSRLYSSQANLNQGVTVFLRTKF